MASMGTSLLHITAELALLGGIFFHLYGFLSPFPWAHSPSASTLQFTPHDVSPCRAHAMNESGAVDAPSMRRTLRFERTFSQRDSGEPPVSGQSRVAVWFGPLGRSRASVSAHPADR